MTEQQIERLLASIERLSAAMEALQVSNAMLLEAITVVEEGPSAPSSTPTIRTIDDPA